MLLLLLLLLVAELRLALAVFGNGCLVLPANELDCSLCLFLEADPMERGGGRDPEPVEEEEGRERNEESESFGNGVARNVANSVYERGQC